MTTESVQFGSDYVHYDTPFCYIWSLDKAFSAFHCDYRSDFDPYWTFLSSCGLSELCGWHLLLNIYC